MRIGIVTYHSAYNFGSVLQAYATQKTIEKLGYKVEIVNYRMPSQKAFYDAKPKGVKGHIKNFLYLGQHANLQKRKVLFENFINNELQLTEEVSEPEQAIELFKKYDAMISGSDQIWNKHSNELRNVEWKYMEPYLLEKFSGRKYSYASSIVDMTDSELNMIKESLQRLDKISCREKNASERLEKLLGKKVSTVCDPTLLITGEEWKKKFKVKKNKTNYVLVYSLGNFKETQKIIKDVHKKFEKIKIVVLAPLVPVIKTQGVEVVTAAGPIEFLNYINAAQLVITNSYHGTLFSVNLEKPFFFLKDVNKKDERVSQILKKLELQKQVISDIQNIEKIPQINYEEVKNKLGKYRKESLAYLEDALK